MFEELHQTVLSRFGQGGSAVSMGDWICHNTTIKKRPFNFTDYPFQKAIADDMHTDMTVIKCSQVGLALALDTPVPTPRGWTTMGDVAVGDELYDEKGQPCRVTYVSPIYLDHECYRVTFDDGEEIIADAKHRWYVETDRAFDLSGNYSGRGRPGPNAEMFKAGVLNTETIARFVHKGDRNRFAVPVAGPLLGLATYAPIDPYYLGLWLGDGNLHASVLTTHEDDVGFYREELSRRGMTVKDSSRANNAVQITVHREGHKRPGRGPVDSIPNDLDMLGLLQNRKAIPLMYLRAPAQVRRDLLCGLMDTDGSITKRGRCSFYNTSLELVAGVEELARSLGYKTRTRWRDPVPGKLHNGHVINSSKRVAEVSFVAYSDEPVFLLPRKRERMLDKTDGRPTEAFRRRIIDVEKVGTVPVRCLTVDSPNHLFLAGRGMVPTHNTEVQIRKFLALLARGQSRVGIFTLPNEKMFTRVYNGRIKPILSADDIFNPVTGESPVRRRDQIQIRDSFGYITGCTEGDATSTSADFLMHDEWDLSPQEILALYTSRIQNSDMRMTQRFSTPTFHGFGIDRFYALSDQREYMARCDACNHWQIPVFTPRFVHVGNDCPWEVSAFDSLTLEQISVQDFSECHVKCEQCHRRLDLADPDKREWVATYPGRIGSRGYRVRPFSTARLHPDYLFSRLLHYKREGFLRGFYNTVLGEPYTAVDAQIQRADIEYCMGKGTPGVPQISDATPVFLGVDIGMTCHLTLSIDTPEGLPHFIHFEHFHISELAYKIADLRKIFNIAQGAADRFPYTTDVNNLRDQTGRLIMPVQYRGQGALAPVKDELGNVDHYSANRTAILDRIHSLITHHSMVLSGYNTNQETLIAHISDMVRDERPDAEATWKKTAGNDHFFHAMGLSLLARRICEHMYVSDNSEIHTSTMLIVPSGRTSVKAMLPMNRRRVP